MWTPIAKMVCLFYLFSIYRNLDAAPNDITKKRSDPSIESVDFEKIRNSAFFVDKTMLLNSILRSMAKVVQITYPRGWGKSVNLQMIGLYFNQREAEKSKRTFKGTNIDKCSTCATAHAQQAQHPVIHVDFEGTEAIEGNFWTFLTKMKSAIARAFSQHKYLEKKLQKDELLQFQYYLQEEPTKNILEEQLMSKLVNLKNVIQKEIGEQESAKPSAMFNKMKAEHTAVIESSNKTAEEKQKRIKEVDAMFKGVIKNASLSDQDVEKHIGRLKKTGAEIAKTMSEMEVNKTDRLRSHVVKSLSFLSRLVKEETGKPSVVTVDNYDAAIVNAFLQTENSMVKYIVGVFNDLFKETFQTLSDVKNKHPEATVKFGLITGISRIADETFSPFDIAVKSNVIESEFFEHYGFTQDEVDNLYDGPFKEKFPGRHVTKEQLRSSFDGYRLANNITAVVYNPWSIISSLSVNKIARAFPDSAIVDAFKPLFLKKELCPIIQNLTAGGTQVLNLGNLEFKLEDWHLLKRMVNEEVEINEHGKEVVLRLLVTTGCLTLADKERNKSVGHRGFDTAVLKVATGELRAKLSQLLVK